MKCFAAIDLPEELSKKLSEIQSRLKAFGIKGSFTGDYHLTLKFLGELSPQKVEHVKDALSRVRLKKFTAALDGLGVFPGEGPMRVVWIGLTPEDDIAELKKSVDESLQKDFRKDGDFKAHVTLARIRYVQDRERFLRFLKGIQTGGAEFEVSGFKLKRSILTAEGPVYDDLKVYASP